MCQTDLEGIWWFLCDSMNRFGPRLRESSLPASLAQKYRTGRHGARRTMSLHRKQIKIQEFQGVFVLKDLFSVTYFAHDRLKNSVWFTVFSKKQFFVKRGICRSHEEYGIRMPSARQHSPLNFQGRGSRSRTISGGELFTYSTCTHTHTHIIYIYIYIDIRSTQNA